MIPAAKRLLPVLVVLAALGLPAGCATPGKPADLDCESRIDWQVTPEAVISRFACASGEADGRPAAFFTAEIRNVTQRPRRFRLNVFLLADNLAGGRNVPETGSRGLDAGASTVVRVPVYRARSLQQPVVVTLKPIW